MNFKLLYTYFRHERKHNGRDKLEKTFTSERKQQTIIQTTHESLCKVLTSTLQLY